MPVLFLRERREQSILLVVLHAARVRVADGEATFDSSAWNAGYGYVALAIVAAIAFYAFKTSLAGRPVFAGGNLDG